MRKSLISSENEHIRFTKKKSFNFIQNSNDEEAAIPFKSFSQNLIKLNFVIFSLLENIFFGEVIETDADDDSDGENLNSNYHRVAIMRSCNIDI